MLNPAAREESVAFGVIVARLGGEERLLRTRKIASARAWKAKMARTLGGTLAEFDVAGRGGGDSIAALLALSDVGGESILDLVIEYDENEDLGGREWVEANADEFEVYALFRAILDRHFPFVRDVLGMIRELARLMADVPVIAGAVTPAQSPPANSPNGPSPRGTSARPTSKRASTRRS